MTNKLPQITFFFWVMKIAATTLGETAGDLLSMTLHLGYATSSLVFAGFFAVTLLGQIFSSTFMPVLYWAVILSTSTVGTTLSDFMNRTLGIGYARGSVILATLLLATLGIWHFVTGSLSVKEVTSRKAELFYWVAILFSNTLGTSLGDYLADDSGLGFGGGALLIVGLLVVIVGAVYLTKVSGVLLFWMAFILTRPLGATLGDLLTKESEQGGLNFGTAYTSAFLFVILASGLCWTSLRSHRKQI